MIAKDADYLKGVYPDARIVGDFSGRLSNSGEAIVLGRMQQSFARNYNVATVYKRARGVGTITAIEGLDELQRRFGQHVVWNTLSPPGTPRRDWLKTLVSDGFVMLRHPDLASTIESPPGFSA